MRLEKYLTEGISDILYHSTSMNALESILKMDAFKLTTSIGTGAEEVLNKKGKFFYFSTTRNRLGAYSKSPSEGSVMLKLDGRKLGYNYSGNPVDYWGPEFRKMQPTSAEAEDRIYHTEPFIKKAIKYIMEIHVLLPEGLAWSWSDQTDQRNRLVRNIYKMALQKKVQIFFYDDKKSYLVQNKAKAIKVDVQDLKPQDKMEYRKEYPRTNFFKMWEELFYIDKMEKLSKRARDKVYYLAGRDETDFYFKDLLSSLEADIHNDKSNPKISAIVVKMFKKAKVTSAKGLLLYLANKWGEILKDD